MAGDIEINPGPHYRFPCGDCEKPVKSNQHGLLCSDCEKWFHTKCERVSLTEYKRLYANPTDPWICTFCSLPTFTDSFFDNSDLHVSNNLMIPWRLSLCLRPRSVLKALFLVFASTLGVCETKWWIWCHTFNVNLSTLFAFPRHGLVTIVIQMNSKCQLIT